MRYKTLLVDDQPQTMELLKNVLQSRAFEVVHASNPEEATQMLMQELPHLLVVDIDLGREKNGLDWLESVRNGPLRFVPAIVMTSSNAMENAMRAVKLEIDDYILKPADFNILSKKIFKICRKMEETPLYSVTPANNRKYAATLSTLARIAGVSETGICIGSPVSLSGAHGPLQYSSTLFSKVGAKDPILSPMHTGNEPLKRLGYTFRNYCQIQGWTEKERRLLRQWINQNNLSTLAW